MCLLCLQGKFSFVEENEDKSDDCYYLFDLAHEAACTAVSAVPKKLSTGSILLIVCVSLLFICSRYSVSSFLNAYSVIVAFSGAQQVNAEFCPTGP